MMAEAVDDWQPVSQAPPAGGGIDDWQAVGQQHRAGGLTPDVLMAPLPIPAAFLKRVAAGEHWEKLSRIGKKITGQIEGEERFQFWPETMIRSAVTAPGDAMAGRMPLMGYPGLRREDFTDIPDERQLSKDYGGLAGRLGIREAPSLGPYGEAVERAGDTANFVVGSTVFSMIRPGSTPLIQRQFGLEQSYARPAAGGADDVIGTLPREQDVKTAASLFDNPSVAEENLRRAWDEHGIHPAEAASDAAKDAWLKHEIGRADPDPAAKLPADAWSTENLVRIGEDKIEMPARSLGAAAVPDEPPLVPLSVQPAPPPGGLSAVVRDATNTMFDIGRDIQMMIAPMARGTTETMAIAKDFANAQRRNRWEWSRIDDDVATRFTPEQRKRMWDAADEESVARQLGESREHQGLATLTDVERAAVEDLQSRAQIAWVRARDLGMVQGEGLPAYTPRMLINVATNEGRALPLNVIGRNVTTTSPNLRHRKHLTAEETEAAAKGVLGEEAVIARDIRTLPLATARLEDAIAGRTLIENIKEYGRRAGDEVVSEGSKPGKEWFTLDHPAFRTWRPKLEVDPLTGKSRAMTKDGETVFEQVPLYIRSDFEGPLRAVLDHTSSQTYSALMTLKGKTMSVIMNSPLIHNAVEWGRAVPAMPGKVATFKVYFEGYRAKHNVEIMREAIDAGLVPIGKRFFNQDITSIMEAPDLTPGRSWTAKVLAFVPGLFDEGAGVAVKRAVDKAGDFWHNTLLWDRIADLQVGLYTNFQADLMAKGVDRTTSARVAAHWANRYAGALPKEAMSDAATKIANFLLFSRSFTLGNMGVMKDMLNGLPRDVMAQIERDAGFRPGSIEAGKASKAGDDVAAFTRTMARRKAIAIIGIDIALMYVMNSVLQNTMNILANDSTLEAELHGYADRFKDMLTEVREHPMKLLQPLELMESQGATSENEPGRKDRVRVGSTKDGTAIYGRNPVGKIGEEFVGYMFGPLDMLRRKLGTIARPGWQILSNDAGFGRKVYDPTADTPAEYVHNMGRIVWHMFKSQFPEGQMRAFADLVKGEGDPKVNALQSFGPIVGVTFSKGAPGGPAVGEMYHARQQHQFQVDMALGDIRRQIQRGDVTGAVERMTELGIPPGLQKFYIKTSLNPATRLSPRAVRDFYLYATPQQRERLENAR